MDADLKAELDAAADAAIAACEPADERAVSLKKVLTDGICRIVDVQEQLHPPCVGIIYTDLGEKFPVFALRVREQALALQGRRVKLVIEMSSRGTRYVTGMTPLPAEATTDYWPCARCGAPTRVGFGAATGSRAGIRVVELYRCTSCAYQMEVGP